MAADLAFAPVDSLDSACQLRVPKDPIGSRGHPFSRRIGNIAGFLSWRRMNVSLNGRPKLIIAPWRPVCEDFTGTFVEWSGRSPGTLSPPAYTTGIEMGIEYIASILERIAKRLSRSPASKSFEEIVVCIMPMPNLQL